MIRPAPFCREAYGLQAAPTSLRFRSLSLLRASRHPRTLCHRLRTTPRSSCPRAPSLVQSSVIIGAAGPYHLAVRFRSPVFCNLFLGPRLLVFSPPLPFPLLLLPLFFFTIDPLPMDLFPGCCNFNRLSCRPDLVLRCRDLFPRVPCGKVFV